MLHYLYSLLGLLVIAQIYAPLFFENLVAHIVPLYCVVVLIAFASYFRSKRSVDNAGAKEYKLKKPVKVATHPTAAVAESPDAWKLQFVGTWDKIDRPGFKEFAMFVGKSSFVASIAERQAFGNIIAFKDSSEKELKIEATGTPAQAGVWCEIGGPEVECKDPNGNPIFDKIWWDEPNKMLCRSLCSTAGDPNGNDMFQSREIMDDGTMVSKAKLTRRKDGKFCEYKVIFKRK